MFCARDNLLLYLSLSISSHRPISSFIVVYFYFFSANIIIILITSTKIGGKYSGFG